MATTAAPEPRLRYTIECGDDRAEAEDMAAARLAARTLRDDHWNATGRPAPAATILRDGKPVVAITTGGRN